MTADFCNPFAKRDCFLDIAHFVYVDKYKKTSYYISFTQSPTLFILVGEPKSRIVQKHTFFAPERYTAGILYTDSLNSA